MIELPVEHLQKEVVAETKLRTKLWAEKFGYIEPVKQPKSDKGKQAQAIIKQTMGTQGQAYAALMGVLLNDEIAVASKPDEVTYDPCVMVVPTGASNSHNYPLDKPALNRPTVGSDYFVKMDGEIGNHMISKRTEVRPATDAEIETYFAAQKQADISKVAIELLTFPVN